MHVRHAMNLHEASTCLGAVDNIKTFLDAFNNPEWTAGKIADGWLTQDGLDDIYIKLGYDLVRTLKKHIGLYACTSIPTGNKPCSCYLFEPLVGTVHARIGGGLNASVLFADHDNRQWTVLTDVRYCYAFANNERRSFDLTCNGDWSRYLLLVTEAQQFNTLPAINLCTHDVRVTLGSTIDLWAALHYEHAQHHIEVGYNFWWRDRESINMCTTCFCDNYYIYNLASGCDPALSCSPTANISQSVDGTNAVSSTTSCTPLKSTDLNSCSAAHPRTHTHKIYGALAYHGKQHDFPVMMGLGISYEFAPRIYVRANCWPRKIKTALEQWAVWCSFGAAF